jgi:hypothetical protein
MTALNSGEGLSQVMMLGSHLSGVPAGRDDDRTGAFYPASSEPHSQSDHVPAVAVMEERNRIPALQTIHELPFRTAVELKRVARGIVTVCSETSVTIDFMLLL